MPMPIQRRLASVFLSLARRGRHLRRGHWPRRNTTPAPPTPKSRSATSCPTAARPPPTASSARPRPPISRCQRRRRHQRAQDQFHLLRRRLQPAESGRAGAQAGREDEVLLRLQALGTPSNAAIQKYMNTRRCRNCLSPPAPQSGTTRRTFPGPWAGSPVTRAKRASTPNTYLGESRPPRSPCSSRMTITARTICRA